MTDDRQDENPLSSAYETDRVCDAFEAEWLRGNRPQIADFIQCAVVGEQDNLFYELLLVELEYRHNQGEQPSRDEYLNRYPLFAKEVETASFQVGKSAFAASVGADDDTVRERVHQLGSLIGRFELLEQLGAGAMGEVWKAWDARLQRPVAIKLPRTQALTESDLRRFLREGRAAAQLRHPQLASVHEVCRDGDTAYIVADYVEGQNLRQYLRSTKLGAVESATESAKRRPKYIAIAGLCAEVAEALHHAHEQGIIHRDLKPANIIIDRAGQPHVIDFGLAKWSNDDRDLTLQGELLGTPAYMSPEQAGGDAVNLDRRTDVYSLGVILYEMLTGKCPFSGGQATIIHQVLAIDPVLPRKIDGKIPRDLETICTKALEKDPDRRYATMQEMAVDFRRFGRGEAILARRVGRIERSWRWVRQHPGVTVATILLAAVLTGATALVYSDRKANERLGKLPVVVDSEPSSAHVAILPIDKFTGEPDSNPKVATHGVTPLSTYLSPGKYFLEVVVPSDGGLDDIAEVVFDVSTAGETSSIKRKRNRDLGYEERQIEICPRILKTSDVIANMVVVQIPENVRRKNLLLPSVIYVDDKESTPNTIVGQPSSATFDVAQKAVESLGKRIPSKAEYDAILLAIKDREVIRTANGRLATLHDLTAENAEWTTTKYQYPGVGQLGPQQFGNILLLMGYDPDHSDLTGLLRMPDGSIISPPDAKLPMIGFRGVRSGTPRFVRP